MEATMQVYYTGKDAGEGLCTMMAYGDNTIKATQLIPGQCYQATGVELRQCKLTRILSKL